MTTTPIPAVSSPASLVLELWLGLDADRRRAITSLLVATATLLLLAAGAAHVVGAGLSDLITSEGGTVSSATVVDGVWDPFAPALPADHPAE